MAGLYDQIIALKMQALKMLNQGPRWLSEMLNHFNTWSIKYIRNNMALNKNWGPKWPLEFLVNNNPWQTVMFLALKIKLHNCTLIFFLIFFETQSGLGDEFIFLFYLQIFFIIIKKVYKWITERTNSIKYWWINESMNEWMNKWWMNKW